MTGEESNLIGKVSEKLFKYFSSDQPFYAKQKDDGKYEKKYGFLTEGLIEKLLIDKGSIAVYQKQQDFTVKWLCFDFDILKEHLDSDIREKAEVELTKSVRSFASYLNDNNIPFTLEFSGNRGYHLWIFFDDKVLYSTASNILEKLVEMSGLTYDKSLVSLDKFPKTPKPSSGVGLGVKLPLSHHKKSKTYSYLIDKSAKHLTNEKISVLNEDLLNRNLEILNNIKYAYISDIEKVLGCFFPKSEYFIDSSLLVKSIKTSKKISYKDVIEHWEKSKLISPLSSKIKNGHNLNNNERQLIVGILHRLGNIGISIIHSIFSTMENYNKSITQEAIESLNGYYFPNQSMIEHYLDTRLEEDLETDCLIGMCIPNFESYESADFEFSIQDIDIVRKSELNYLYSNDEVKSRLISDDLINKTNLSLLLDFYKVLNKEKPLDFYRHIRIEESKNRELISLGSSERVATSLLTKQISKFLDVDFGNFSHGYQINKGFNNLHIFKPWLKQWHGFISNISNAIDEPLFRDCYIVKTDIKSFYDSIPHSRLQRILLGETNSAFSSKIKRLKSSEFEKYKQIINALIDVTKKTNKGNIGLPQGPAYARYLAELYLSEIDLIFKELYYNGKVFLYQRYVDDIFFICEFNQHAEEQLKVLKNTLSTLGLTLNTDKTIIKKIEYSKSDFDNYKSQSKYTVESVNKEITIANENQKEMALEEFINLIESDSAQHDLSFIFSHLREIPELDEMKLDIIPEVINSGIGRGSMYRNMFNFLIQSPNSFQFLLSEIEFNVLQSEVITSAMLDAYESDHTKWNQFHSQVEFIENKLNFSDLVEENLCYISLYYGYTPKYKISKDTYFKVLSKPNTNKIFSNIDLFTSFELELNEIDNLPDLVNILYSIGFSIDTNSNLIKFAMDTLIDKLAIEKISGRIDIHDSKNLLTDELVLSKLYSFLCLITIAYSDSELSNSDITSYWEICIKSFDELKHEHSFNAIEWANYLDFLSVDYARLNYVLSHISEGGLIRGVEDKRNLFLNYNSVLLVHFILEDTKNTSSHIELTDEIKKKLVETSSFYSWLLDKKGTEIFPCNKDWFDSNALKNGTIVLKNGEQILIRKKGNDYTHQENVKPDKFGYSDLVVDYDLLNLTSLESSIKNKEPKYRIEFLSKLTNGSSSLPAIFTKDPVLFKDSSKLFSDEFTYTEQIIFESKNKSVTTPAATIINYIDSYFKALSDINEFENKIYNKYFLKLDSYIDKNKFYTELSKLYIPNNIEDYEIGVDLLCSAAIYNSLESTNSIDKISLFLKQYVKIHNENYFNMSVFAVDKSMTPSQSSLDKFIDALINSPTLISSVAYSGLDFNLANDFKKLKSDIEHIISQTYLHAEGVSLQDFSLAHSHRYKTIEKTINIDGKDIHHDNFEVINLSSMSISKPNIRNTSDLRGADKIYFYNSVDGYVVLPIPASLNMAWKIISERYNQLITQQSRQTSYQIINDVNKVRALPKFSNASYVIEEHNQILSDEAESRLSRWLISVPETERELVIKLISAHECMTKNDMNEFIAKVSTAIEKQEQVLMIKNPEDYNGTHRIFYQDINNKLNRALKLFSPIYANSCVNRNTTVTFVVDNILSGTQFISAMKYYAGETQNYPKNSNLYKVDRKDRSKISKFFKNLERINIITVVYNTTGLNRIKHELQSFMPNLKSVEVSGKDIKGNAFFGTTTHLSAKDKKQISEFLLNNEKRKSLYDSLGIKFDLDQRQYASQEELNKVNLVSRYCSMPKRCFLFLVAPSIFDRSLQILNRVEELNDKPITKD